MYLFNKISIFRAQELIQDADNKHAFLASRSEPDFSVLEFLLTRSKEKNFNLFVTTKRRIFESLAIVLSSID